MPKVVVQAPEKLRPYLFHGIELEWQEGRKQAIGTCPWCGREGKFGVSLDTGQWKCLVCQEGNEKGGGEVYRFLRMLWEKGCTATDIQDYASLSADRNMLEPDTLMRWGFCKSILKDAWLVPGCNIEGSLHQLYMRAWDAKKERWFFKPTPGLGHALHMIGKPSGRAVYVCYSDDTEVLTKTGWKAFPILGPSDKVAAYEMATGKIQWEVPSARQKFSYSGNMIEISSKHCNMLVTPDHRVLYTRPNCGLIVKRAEDITSKIHVPVSGILGVQEGDYPTLDQARLLTAFVADGNIERRGFRLRFGLTKKRKKTRLKTLLKRLDIPWFVQRAGRPEHEMFTIDRRVANFVLRFCPNKTWETSAIDWPLAVREAILEEIPYWDGDKHGNSFRYFTSKRAEADIISSIAAISGYSCTMRITPPRAINHSPEHVLNLSKSRWKVVAGHPTKSVYRGNVYCVTVSTGFVVTRRNGKAVVSGNCEGPWDAPALWEIARQCKETEQGYTATANEASSLLADSCIVAVPSCGAVGEPFTRWLPMFAGKRVVLMFDGDHPHPKPDGTMAKGAGFAATQRAARLLSEAKDPPEEILWLCWGPEGYDPALKSGYDIRDHLGQASDLSGRIARLGELFAKLEKVPEAWLAKRSRDPVRKGKGLATAECKSYSKMIGAWEEALKWRQDIEDTLTVMLAVALSTAQIGDQLFLMIIGCAGSAKTRLCDALLVSDHCFALEHLTGFHSGYKGKGQGEEDYSLISRVNYKTLITPEGDVVMSGPHFAEIMSQQRRIFDGTAGATYKNRKEDLRYTGLRTPWIMAGTPALMDVDQSRLGDRFLKVYIEAPSEEERIEILWEVGLTALRSVLQTSNGDARGHIDDKLCKAYQLTGGYVDYLRANARELLGSVVVEPEYVLPRCMALAEFTADMRARPDLNPNKEHGAIKEQPTRLMHQFVRLAYCIAAVLQKGEVDDEVMRLVKKVAMDTGRGKTLAIASHLYDFPGGKGADSLANLTAQTNDRVRSLVRFMKAIDITESFESKSKGLMPKVLWRLTERFRDLYQRVVES